ncbi:Uncharacterized protein DBV15_00126 [Temnothorax longispinosus]|uniref:Uncharacterized protein n=1 Tax=Temnothorax longispinosus TaxID=300112 RepID=A0A4S2KDA8_9HYME|nr:Uncharacterized protein DBV15_00126 [Temnothorax longispinosus]
MSLGTDERERRARLFSRGNREKNFPEISDVEEGVGKHRRDIPGKMIIRSWKNFAETKQQFLAMSPLRAHLSWNRFRWDTIFTMSNCWLSLVSRGVAERLTGSGSPRTIFLANTKPIATPSMTEGTTRRGGFEDRGAILGWNGFRNRGDSCCGGPSAWPHRDIFPFIGHKSNNAMLYDTRADAEVRQNDTNASISQHLPS